MFHPQLHNLSHFGNCQPSYLSQKLGPSRQQCLYSYFFVVSKDILNRQIIPSTEKPPTTDSKLDVMYDGGNQAYDSFMQFPSYLGVSVTFLWTVISYVEFYVQNLLSVLSLISQVRCSLVSFSIVRCCLSLKVSLRKQERIHLFSPPTILDILYLKIKEREIEFQLVYCGWRSSWKILVRVQPYAMLRSGTYFGSLLDRHLTSEICSSADSMLTLSSRQKAFFSEFQSCPFSCTNGNTSLSSQK